MLNKVIMPRRWPARNSSGNWPLNWEIKMGLGRRLQEALNIAAKTGNLRLAVYAGNDIAGVYWQQGDYTQALAYLQQALTTATEIGYSRILGVIVGNGGEIYEQQGDYLQALTCYRQALHLSLEIGDWTMVPHVLGNMATVYTAKKEYQKADGLFFQATTMGRILNIPYRLCQDLYHLAECYQQQKLYREAQASNEQALSCAAEAGRRDIQFETSLLNIRLQLALAQIDQQRAISQLEALLDHWSEESEQAAINYELWQLNPEQTNSKERAASLYLVLYRRSFNIKYRQRYEALTNHSLPDPPDLPPLPKVVAEDNLNLDNLLRQVEQFIRQNQN
jgi:tetratricopeptide (TPR) repeat protein